MATQPVNVLVSLDRTLTRGSREKCYVYFTTGGEGKTL